MPTINATVGGAASNSYELLSEANDYFDERIPLPTPWVASGDASIRALITATSVLDRMSVPRRTLRSDKCDCQYNYTSRYWTGSPASAGQRLAWPRLGMYDHLGRPLDFAVSSITAANPAVVTTTVPHRQVSGDKVLIIDSNSTPTIDGERVVTVISATSFSVSVNVTTAGTSGKVAVIPQELKDAQSELAGQLLIADTTLDNSVQVGGITSVRSGSVAVTFKDMIQSHVLPDAVVNLMPPSWLYDEVVEPAVLALFDVVSYGSDA